MPLLFRLSGSMYGSMGHSSSIALGIAIQKPGQSIWCIDGDVRQKAPESDEQVIQSPVQSVVPEVVAKAQELFGEQLVEVKND